MENLNQKWHLNERILAWPGQMNIILVKRGNQGNGKYSFLFPAPQTPLCKVFILWKECLIMTGHPEKAWISFQLENEDLAVDIPTEMKKECTSSREK